MLKSVQFFTTALCAIGFIYGAAESWLKYDQEPLSSTTTEVPLEAENPASVTICRMNMDLFPKKDLTNVTFEEIKSELGMELVGMNHG